MALKTLLSVRDLSICFGEPGLAPAVVDRVSFDLRPGETLALVGESGSGKTLTGKALMGLLPRAARLFSGHAHFCHPDGNVDLLQISQRRMRALRGCTISMIFQEPMSALSPLHPVGAQVAEVLRVHGRNPGTGVERQVLDMFEEVGFPDPVKAYESYPFQLSGGLRQRAVIAMAMVAGPALVIADEPTTALDVTTQATVLELLRRLQQVRHMSVVLITHDLGVVANMADSAVVLSRGHVVERGPAVEVLMHPIHPYTRKLIAAAPRIPHDLERHRPAGNDAILRVANLSKTFVSRQGMFGRSTGKVRAVSDFDMVLERGRTVAVVGESGSGKSTVAKMILRAIPHDPGATLVFCGADGTSHDLTRLSGSGLKAFRRRCQLVFQDPYASLSPRMSVQDILTEPLKIHGVGKPSERRARAAHLMERVGLSPDHLARFPFAFSGGQRQRIAIARALALSPELLICDEPTSALDVSVQAEVLELLEELKAEMGLTYLFISHDLAVVSRLAERVLVMRRGRVIEEGSCDCIFNDPRHPYTQALIAASPDPEPAHRLNLAAVSAGAGSSDSWPEPYGYPGDRAPGLVEVAPGHLVRAAA